jgi:sec-independent protein translocase protein TatA
MMTGPFFGPGEFHGNRFSRTAGDPVDCARALRGKKLKSVGSDLGSAVRGFKKAMSDGEDEQSKQLSDLTTGKDADFVENTAKVKPDTKPSALTSQCSRWVSPRSC